MASSLSTLLVCGLCAAAAGLPICCEGRALQANGPSPAVSPAISGNQGLGPYLKSSTQYSLFYSFLQQDYFYVHELARDWLQGPTNNTVLLPTDSAVREGFEMLAEEYGIRNSSRPIADRILSVAESYNNGAGIQPTELQGAVANVVAAFMRSHILTESINFYKNSTVLGPQHNYYNPFYLPTDGLGNVTDSPGAFGQSLAPGPERVYIRQPNGLLHVTDGLIFPTDPTVETGPNSYDGPMEGPMTLYLYSLDGIFVAGETAAGDVPGGSTSDALQILAEQLPA